MAKRLIIILAVVAFLGSCVAASALVSGYVTYVTELVSTSKDTTNWYGFQVNSTPDAYSNYQTQVFYSPGDDTSAVLHSIANGLGAPIRPDAFSYNNDIPAWLNNPARILSYSTVQNFDETGLNMGGPFGKFGFNDDIINISSYGCEAIVDTAQIDIPPHGVSLGQTDIIAGNGRLVRQNEFDLTDYDWTSIVPDVAQRIYFSAGRNSTSGGGSFDLNQQVNRPNVTYGSGGSDYTGKANAADVLTGTYDGDGNLLSSSYFEKAWKIAGTMLGDTFWTSGLVWNTYFGYVSTSTSSNAGVALEAAGHSVIRNFMRYVFDIDAMKVYDQDSDGLFDVADGDAILFSVQDPKYYTYFYDWTNTWRDSQVAPARKFTGEYFEGDTMFLYRGGTVTTYMDPDTSIFFGQTINTWSGGTIWAEKYGKYDLNAFDIDMPIPEPSTIILVVGAVLTLGAGVLRKRMR